MLKSFKYELRPTIEQKTQLNQAIGACRFVYNLALETKIAAYQSGKNYSCFDLMKQLTELKKELIWLKEIPSQSLQQAISNLDNSYANFFKGRASFPKYKKKTNGGSFRIPTAVDVDFENWTIKLPKYGKVSFNRDRKFYGNVKQATVSKAATGRYFISILVDTLASEAKLKPIKEETAIGIDLGIKHFAVLSNGTKIENPRNTLLGAKKLRVEQRSLSRKKKGSKRRNRQVLVVAKCHEKVKNKRNDFLHKLSSEITNQYDAICLETLNVSGMIKNKKLSKHIADVSWSEFVRQLEYKSNWKGVNVIRIGRFEPSSKMCSCGKINNELKLSQREWTCTHCNTTHDRDTLAANNIKRFGLRTQPNKRQREAIACA
jgi:putative transposase